MTHVWTWLRGRRSLVDLALAAALWLVLAWLPTGAVFFDHYGFYADHQLQLLSGALMAAPVAIRRSAPSVALAASCLAGVAELLAESSIQAIDTCFLFAVYAVATYEQRRGARYAALVVGWLAAVVCAVRWSTAGGATSYLPTVVVLLGLSVTATWTGGALVRTRRAATAQALERARQSELDRERALRLAASQERTQIARELHDIVAHSLAVMIVQADGGRYAAAADPQKAAGTLEIIAATGREALGQMRHLLGVLRDGEPTPGAALPTGGAPAPVTPQPVLEDLPALLDGVRRAGVRIDGQLAQPLPQVPAQVAAVAYRIVQESLTNVLKHAGPRAVVSVSVTAAGGRLRVEVRDDGRGTSSALAAPDGNPGRGLLGMRERAALVYGQVSAGPAAGGGWVVAAALPLDGSDSRRAAVPVPPVPVAPVPVAPVPVGPVPVGPVAGAAVPAGPVTRTAVAEPTPDAARVAVVR